MSVSTKDWNAIFFRIGVVLFIIGTLDPMEGSILILIGSIVFAAISISTQKKYWKAFTFAAILITIGVAALFLLSSLGGFGGKSSLSWWWGLTILPYPIGWLMNVIFLIKTRRKMLQEKKQLN